MHYWINLMIFAILFLGCGEPTNISSIKEPVMKPTAGTSYMYSDGSANRYRVSRDSFEYIPVKPEESSTGQYDGGQPLQSATDPVLFEKFGELVQSAFKTKEEQVDERGKGCAIVEIISASGTNVFILAMHSAKRREIELLLAEMKKNK